jgi:hypothetical protein
MARYDLRLSEPDFWWMTPIQLRALNERHAQAWRDEATQTALLACYIANFSMAPPKKPLTLRDFGLGTKAKIETDHPATPEEINDYCNTWRMVAKMRPAPAAEEKQDAE